MKIAALLMLLLALTLSVLVLITGRSEPATGLVIVPDGPYTFAEREAAMFPDGPHWILRGIRQQDLVSLSILLLVSSFSVFCSALALRTFFTGQGGGRMPWIAAAGILPIWIGVCLTFVMLRLLPHYTGHDSYHHERLGAIRVGLFTCLVAGLTPAILAVAAHLRHPASPTTFDAAGTA